MKWLLITLVLVFVFTVDCVDVEIYAGDRGFDLTLGAVPEQFDVYIENDRVKIYYITKDTMIDATEYYKVVRTLPRRDTVQARR